MKKQEMTVQQLDQRELIVKSLLIAGWQAASNQNDMFDNGLWVQFEAVLEYAGPQVSLVMFYWAEQSSLGLTMQMADESTVELKMSVDSRLRDLLGVITSIQNQLTSTNYKKHIRSLMAACESIFVMVEGEKFVRLTDNEK